MIEGRLVALGPGELAEVGVEVGGRRNAAGEGAAARVEQHGLGRGEHVEAFRDGGGLTGVIHVAGRILQADDARAVGVEQALQQGGVPVQAGLLRVVIEVDRDGLLRRRLHDGVDVGHETVVGHPLVVERRQHQRAGKAELRGITRQRHGIGHGGGAGADHHAVER